MKTGYCIFFETRCGIFFREGVERSYRVIPKGKNCNYSCNDSWGVIRNNCQLGEGNQKK